MKREIKFRGLHQISGKKIWVYGFVSKDGKHWYIHPDAHTSYGVVTESVGQYTGLCDDIGKEIYEGDLMDTQEGMMQVFFIDGRFIIMWADNGTYRSELHDVNKRLTVCGNIYENPSLIKPQL